jgi:hypothetical protein
LSRHSVSLPAKAGHTANPPFGGREEPNATNKRGCGFVGGVPGCVPWRVAACLGKSEGLDGGDPANGLVAVLCH